MSCDVIFELYILYICYDKMKKRINDNKKE